MTVISITHLPSVKVSKKSLKADSVVSEAAMSRVFLNGPVVLAGVKAFWETMSKFVMVGGDFV